MRRTEMVMGGLPFSIVVPGAAEEALLDAIFSELQWIEHVFSPFDPASEVSRIATRRLREEDAHPLVHEVLRLCRSFEVHTGGYFSAWASGTLDPCGLVKGWAIRRACDMLDRAGHRAYYVDGAGDVFARGDRAFARPWRVGIRHPIVRDRVVAVVPARDLAVATSGSYERGPHIIDPHTRHAATELVSLTVIGPDIVAADAYATAAFAMGRAGLAFVDSIAGYEALAIDSQLYAASTPGFEQLLAA